MTVASAKQVAAAVSVADKRCISVKAIDRKVYSCWCEGENLHIQFTDNTELVITWGSKPEIRGSMSLSALPAEPLNQGPVGKILHGKVVQYAYINDKDELVIRCKDDHEAVIAWVDNGPVLRAMDVKLVLEPVSLFGDVSL